LTIAWRAENASFSPGAPHTRQLRWAFAALASQWREFSADDKVEIARRLKTHLEAMRKDPQLYAHSKEFGAGISTSSPMFRLIVRNIARADRYPFLTGYRSNDQLYIDSAAGNRPYE